ncbi:inositol-3-phosphate synthase [Myxococcota bacterium]|nr:inositol-3-phosphate synthase [Myxococcota bacterium]MBU1379528.1 inositol-3-phosphate synthase [Myxococcota bacterium]MBU1498962.1 inositol-3-phosphate synthase [Myxococcota bacterium]
MDPVKSKYNVKPAEGKLGVLIPGMGAVATTFIAGVEAVKRELAKPIGSLTSLGRIRIGKRTENRKPLIRDFISLASIHDIEFATWDVHGKNAWETAMESEVIDAGMLLKLRPALEKIVPMDAVFDTEWVKNIEPQNVKTAPTKMDLAQMLFADIEKFKTDKNVSRCVMLWCGSTEVFTEISEVHLTVEAFEEGLRTNHPAISPSMIYAYAAIKMGIPFLNGAPNLTADIPAMTSLARSNKVAIGGKDFKTGQTLMKTIIAPGLKSRMLGVKGWFSTNILGNLDGLVLDDPGSFKTKETSKLSVLESILNKEENPNLYGDLYHKVRINYYPPRGDNKESWDNIDIVGWMGYPMQIKLNFLCRDSILAAPVCLDLALLADFAQRAGLSGIQEWLSFFWKSPQCAPGIEPIHDLFKQLNKLENTLRHIMGEELITNLGLEYYE